MVLTNEENALLTKVGPGTQMGELLRRYWYPIAVAQDLSEASPAKFVRVLGEDLVLFRDKRGRVGLIQDHCLHRGASLLYGRVEERGIACAYHGWLYDTQGNCLETPAEPADSKLYLTVKARAYPVGKLAGMYWAYLGPDPAPEIPPYDVLVRKDGRRRVNVHPVLDCNWLAAAENAVDPWHLQFLHQDLPFTNRVPVNPTRGYADDIKAVDWYEVPFGIIKQRIYINDVVDEHPFIFPMHLRTRNSLWLRTPIDDEHTIQITVGFRLLKEGEAPEGEDEDSPAEFLPPYKEPANALHPFTKMDFYALAGQPLTQDSIIWETMGPVADRMGERLATSDRGVVMLREMLKREMDKVQEGLDPMHVIRDPSLVEVDTNLTHSLTMDYPSALATATKEVAPRRGNGSWSGR